MDAAVAEKTMRAVINSFLEEGYWISQMLLLIVAAAAAIGAYKQIATQKLTAIIDRTSQHNWEIYRDENCRKAIEAMQSLNVPADAGERDLYWGTRITHLSHILVAQQVWVLAGRPDKLKGTYENWQVMAKFVGEELRGKSAANRPKAYAQACADLWDTLRKFEETDPNFVKWIERISR